MGKATANERSSAVTTNNLDTTKAGHGGDFGKIRGTTTVPIDGEIKAVLWKAGSSCRGKDEAAPEKAGLSFCRVETRWPRRRPALTLASRTNHS